MQLVYANDFEAAKKIYIDVIENTPLIEQYARWVYGKHPTDEQLRAYILHDEMYFLMVLDVISDFFTDRKVFRSLSGFVSEPTEEDRNRRRSSRSD